jgi:hypothetical protein
MQKARVYYRVLRPAPGMPADAPPPPPLHVDDSKAGYSESSIIKFIHDPSHHHDIIAVPGKTREDVESVLKQRYPHGLVVIEKINWLT